MTKAIFPDLEGASVFITGGGSGIGAALVDGFLAQGARVAFIDRDDASGFVQEMAKKHGLEPLFLPGDLTDIASLQDAIATAAQAHGDVTVLVNNVANDVRHDTLTMTPEEWDANQAVNLRPVMFATQAVVPGMRRAGGGRIVNYASVAFMMGNADYPSYAAAKAAIMGLTRAHAREFGPDNIRVNAIAPGWTMTEKQRALWVTPETFGPYLDRQCLRREVLPEDLVGPTLFLASAASTVITGQLVPVDAGVVVTG
ncbi:SDR family NAD(P)-dependent oxidoreductase [Sinisalibacter aestuarii]|uniref:3-oxoacyl-ACP reductase n=1 Tax=Sinisalibacter aestuarii TaxID=2949426 RepID=A0ABQ5LNH8_9RHOB|nr:SDR family oxidoreductase [Sinisalibacter aestuarii]GKY86562.1 3-oxoacyl-ACP reductase [Sinisalibacter aestuarii]